MTQRGLCVSGFRVWIGIEVVYFYSQDIVGICGDDQGFSPHGEPSAKELHKHL